MPNIIYDGWVQRIFLSNFLDNWIKRVFLVEISPNSSFFDIWEIISSYPNRCWYSTTSACPISWTLWKHLTTKNVPRPRRKLSPLVHRENGSVINSKSTHGQDIQRRNDKNQWIKTHSGNLEFRVFMFRITIHTIWVKFMVFLHPLHINF